MTSDQRLERLLADVLRDDAEDPRPAGLADEIIASTGRDRPWPRWLATVAAPPMRGTGSVAVGAPQLRAIVLAATLALLTALVLGAAAVGFRIVTSSVIVVAADGSGDHETIAAALEVAQDGDTILVREGVYDEALTITGDIRLRGEGPAPDRVKLRIPGDVIGIRLKDSDAEVELLTVLSTAEEPAFSAIDVAGGAPILRRLEVRSEPGHRFTAVRLLATEAELHESTLTGRLTIGAGADVLISRNRLRRGDPGTARPLVAGDGVQGGVGRSASVEAIGITTRVELVGNELERFVSVDARSILRENDIGGARDPSVFTQPGDVFGCAVLAGTSTKLVDNVIHDSDTGVCGFVFLEGGSIEGNELAFAWSGSLGAAETDLGVPGVTGARIVDNGMAFRVAPRSEMFVVESAVCRNRAPDVIDETSELTIVDPRPCD